MSAILVIAWVWAYEPPWAPAEEWRRTVADDAVWCKAKADEINAFWRKHNKGEFRMIRAFCVKSPA